jgi:frataxin
MACRKLERLARSSFCVELVARLSPVPEASPWSNRLLSASTFSFQQRSLSIWNDRWVCGPEPKLSSVLSEGRNSRNFEASKRRNHVRFTGQFRSNSSEGMYIDEARYHKEADHTLDVMCEVLERMIEDADIEDADIELSQGVLTLSLGSLGTYVINKQTPNRQIWMSSPLRYVYTASWAENDSDDPWQLMKHGVQLQWSCAI